MNFRGRFTFGVDGNRCISKTGPSTLGRIKLGYRLSENVVMNMKNHGKSAQEFYLFCLFSARSRRSVVMPLCRWKSDKFEVGLELAIPALLHHSGIHVSLVCPPPYVLVCWPTSSLNAQTSRHTLHSRRQQTAKRMLTLCADQFPIPRSLTT